ncbi:hypothetical protein CCP4SC76_1320002 [Gammaproteobacteria bacterium]
MPRYLSLVFKEHCTESYHHLDIVRCKELWEAWLDYRLKMIFFSPSVCTSPSHNSPIYIDIL